MPSFRQRPLTWLFLVASIGLNAVALLGDFRSPRPAVFMALGLIIGQLWCVGGWLAVGQAHRMLRGSLFVLAILWLTTMACLINNSSQTATKWGFALAPVSLMALTAAVAALLASVLLPWKGEGPAGRFRFPVIEFFGWTILVAIAGWALRSADFARLTNQYDSMTFALAASAAAGLALAIAGARNHAQSTVRTAAAISVLVAFAAIAGAAGGIQQRVLYYGCFWALAYVAVRLVVQHFDRGVALPRPSVETIGIRLAFSGGDDD